MEGFLIFRTGYGSQSVTQPPRSSQPQRQPPSQSLNKDTTKRSTWNNSGDPRQIFRRFEEVLSTDRPMSEEEVDSARVEMRIGEKEKELFMNIAALGSMFGNHKDDLEKTKEGEGSVLKTTATMETSNPSSFFPVFKSNEHIHNILPQNIVPTPPLERPASVNSSLVPLPPTPKTSKEKLMDQVIDEELESVTSFIPLGSYVGYPLSRHAETTMTEPPKPTSNDASRSSSPIPNTVYALQLKLAQTLHTYRSYQSCAETEITKLKATVENLSGGDLNKINETGKQRLRIFSNGTSQEEIEKLRQDAQYYQAEIEHLNALLRSSSIIPKPTFQSQLEPEPQTAYLEQTISDRDASLENTKTHISRLQVELTEYKTSHDAYMYDFETRAQTLVLGLKTECDAYRGENMELRRAIGERDLRFGEVLRRLEEVELERGEKEEAVHELKVLINGGWIAVC